MIDFLAVVLMLLLFADCLLKFGINITSRFSLLSKVVHEGSSTLITNDINWMDDNNNFVQNGGGGKISYIEGHWFWVGCKPHFREVRRHLYPSSIELYKAKKDLNYFVVALMNLIFFCYKGRKFCWNFPISIIQSRQRLVAICPESACISRGTIRRKELSDSSSSKVWDNTYSLQK